MTRLRKEKAQKREEEAFVKFDNLAKTLKDASSQIKEMEKVVQAKGKKVKELAEIAEQLESLSSMREGQVEAVKQELKSILKESSKANRIWTVVIGAIWFVLGLIVRGFLGF